MDVPIDARELLEKGNTHSHSSAAPGVLLEKIRPGQPLELETRGTRVTLLQDPRLELDFGHDGLVFSLNAIVGPGKATELAETFDAVILAANKTEPAGAIREEVDSDTKKDGANHLQAKREAKRNVAVEISRSGQQQQTPELGFHTVCHMKSSRQSQHRGQSTPTRVQEERRGGLVVRFLKCREEHPDWLAGAKGGLESTYQCQSSDANTAKEATKSEHSVRRRRSLDDCSNAENDHNYAQRPFAADFVGKPGHEEASQKGTKLQHGSHEALVESIVDLGVLRLELWHHVDDGNYTLVISGRISE